MGTRRALIVGAGKSYKHLPKLKNTKADMEDLAEALTAYCSFEEEDVACFHELDVIDARVKLFEFLDNSLMHRNDQLLIYFTGHCIRKSQQLYFCFADTDPAALEATAINVDHLQKHLRESKARARLMVLDCCYNNAAHLEAAGKRHHKPEADSEALHSDESDTVVNLSTWFGEAGVAIMAASDFDQAALDGPEHPKEKAKQKAWSSLYTQTFTEALTDFYRSFPDKSLSARQLNDEIDERMNQGEKKQSPVYLNFDEKKEFEFLFPRYVPLPEYLLEKIQSQHLLELDEGVKELARLLKAEPKYRWTAKEALDDIVKNRHNYPRSLLVQIARLPIPAFKGLLAEIEASEKRALPLREVVVIVGILAALGAAIFGNILRDTQLESRPLELTKAQRSEIERLLVSAEKKRAGNYLTVPEKGTEASALDDYRAVLHIHPYHPTAISGIEYIFRLYHDKALNAHKRGKPAKSQKYLAKMALIDPIHPSLLDLRQRIARETETTKSDRDKKDLNRNMTHSIEPMMVTIKAGQFQMGCVSDDSSCLADELPVRSVSLKSFELSRFEVTFNQYDAYVLATGARRPDDRGWGRGERPVINVGQDEALAYIEWLNQTTGKQYRLPTEAEWEYAARANTTTKYSWGNEAGSMKANCAGCGSLWDSKYTAPVGQFEPNPWGLFDMHGNVWEWVQDSWRADYTGVPTNGEAWLGPKGSEIVVRGGSWYLGPEVMRSAHRAKQRRYYRSFNIGFRLARDL